MIPNGAPPFIVLTYSAGMMAVSMALLTYIQHLGLSRLRVFLRINAFTYVLSLFLWFLIVQLLDLINIAFKSHFFDPVIIAMCMIAKSFIIAGIIWIIAYREEPIRQPPNL